MVFCLVLTISPSDNQVRLKCTKRRFAVFAESSGALD